MANFNSKMMFSKLNFFSLRPILTLNSCSVNWIFIESLRPFLTLNSCSVNWNSVYQTFGLPNFTLHAVRLVHIKWVILLVLYISTIGMWYFVMWVHLVLAVSTLSPGWLNWFLHRTQYLTKLGWATWVVQSIYFVSIFVTRRS